VLLLMASNLMTSRWCNIWLVSFDFMHVL